MITTQEKAMDPDKTIRTTAAGRRAAAARDGRYDRANAPTRPIMLSSDDRLRAAAPGMLAALRRALGALRASSAEHFARGAVGLATMDREAADVVEAAIANAG